MKTIDYQKRLKWNKNTLLDTSSYFIAYMNSLKEHLSVDDRQEFYMIAKYFTDGVEHARYNLRLSKYYFERGEYYKRKIPANNILLKKIVGNSYDRSKSYFYFKSGNYAMAVKRIHNTLKINHQIRDLFPVLIFDSISQYLNLIKIYISQNNTEQANFILSELADFLLFGENSLEVFSHCNEIILNEKWNSFRLFFTNEIVFNYIFTNSDFIITKEHILRNRKEIKNKLINDFLKLYLKSDKIKFEAFKTEYKDVFRNIPITILEQKYDYM